MAPLRETRPTVIPKKSVSVAIPPDVGLVAMVVKVGGSACFGPAGLGVRIAGGAIDAPRALARAAATGGVRAADGAL